MTAIKAYTASRAKRGEPLKERASAARSRTNHPEGGTPFDNFSYTASRAKRGERLRERASEARSRTNHPEGGYAI